MGRGTAGLAACAAVALRRCRVGAAAVPRKKDVACAVPSELKSNEVAKMADENENNSDDRIVPAEHTADAADAVNDSGNAVGNVPDAAQNSSQPQQSATQEPLYGALQSQYPGYDPYIFGKPDPPQAQAPARNRENAQPADPFAAAWGQNPQNPQGQNAQGPRTPNNYGSNGYGVNNGGQPQQPNPQNGSQYGPNQYGPNQYDPWYGRNPNGYPNNPYPYGSPMNPYQNNGFDPNDPQQNPWAGRWNTWAILAFISALFGLPIISLPFAILALYSIRVTHTKGKGLAIAAIVLTLLDFVAVLVMQHMGITPNEIMTWMQSFPGLDSGDTETKKSVVLSSLTWISQMLH